MRGASSEERPDDQRDTNSGPKSQRTRSFINGLVVPLDLAEYQHTVYLLIFLIVPNMICTIFDC